MAVLSGEQGKGYGRRLIAFAEQEAARRGLAELQLGTNVRMVENIALYAHLGFVETGRMCGEGFARIRMTRPIFGPKLGSRR